MFCPLVVERGARRERRRRESKRERKRTRGVHTSRFHQGLRNVRECAQGISFLLKLASLSTTSPSSWQQQQLQEHPSLGPRNLVACVLALAIFSRAEGVDPSLGASQSSKVPACSVTLAPSSVRRLRRHVCLGSCAVSSSLVEDEVAAATPHHWATTSPRSLGVSRQP